MAITKTQTTSILIINITATLNNTILTATDDGGNVISWVSSGSAGFKGSKRASSYAAQMAAEALVKKLSIKDAIYTRVILKGVGKGREAAVKGLKNGGLYINHIVDNTKIPFNGCRPSKTRRL